MLVEMTHIFTFFILLSGNLTLGQTCVLASQCTGTVNGRRCFEHKCNCVEGFLPHDHLCLHGIYREETYKFKEGYITEKHYTVAILHKTQSCIFKLFFPNRYTLGFNETLLIHC